MLSWSLRATRTPSGLGERGAGLGHSWRRTTPGRPPWAELLLAVVALGPITACGLSDGFADVGGALLDSNDEYFSDQPTQLMAGAFRRAGIIASAGKGSHLVAITNEKKPHLVIQALPEGSPCDAGPAVDFEQFTDVNSDSLVVLALSAQDGQGRRDFAFYDTACDLVTPVIKSALDFGYDCADGQCIQVYLQEDGTLVFLDLETVTRAREIDHVLSYRNHWILTDDGKLSRVAESDLQNSEIYAENVQSFSLGSFAGEVYYQTDEGVERIYQDEHALVAGACLKSHAETSSVLPIVEMPCGSSEQFLVSYEPSTSSLHAAQLPHLDPVSAVGFLGVDLSLATSKEPGGSFDYYRIVDIEKSSDPLTIEHLLSSVQTLFFGPEGDGFALADYDGERGQIYRISQATDDSDYELTRLLSEVRVLGTSPLCPDYFAQVAIDELSNFGCLDRKTGDFEVFARKVIAPTVSRDWVSRDPLDAWIYVAQPKTRRLSLTTDLKDDQARLQIVEYSDGNIETTTTPNVGPVVPQSSAMSLEPVAAFYIDADDQSLSAYYPALDAHHKIADHVSNYVVMNYPTSAVLFVVEAGLDAGIWLSKSE